MNAVASTRSVPSPVLSNVPVTHRTRISMPFESCDHMSFDCQTDRQTPELRCCNACSNTDSLRYLRYGWFYLSSKYFCNDYVSICDGLSLLLFDDTEAIGCDKPGYMQSDCERNAAARNVDGRLKIVAILGIATTWPVPFKIGSLNECLQSSHISMDRLSIDPDHLVPKCNTYWPCMMICMSTCRPRRFVVAPRAVHAH